MRGKLDPGQPTREEHRSEELDAIALELQQVARAPTPIDVEHLRLRALRELARRCPGGEVTTLQSVIERGLARLDGRNQEAALILFADTDQRWQRNLGERQRAAAGVLGTSYDTLRKRRRGRPSRYDQLCRLLAVQIREAVMEEAANTAPNSAKSGPLPRRWAAITALGLAAVALAIVGVSAWQPWGTPEPDEISLAGEPASGSDGVSGAASEALRGELSGAPVEGCDIPLGAGGNPNENRKETAESMRAIFEANGGREALGCPAHRARAWGVLWFQELEGAARHPGVIMTGPEGSGAWAARVVFDAYFATGDADGLAAQDLAGLPVANTSDGLRLDLSDGGAVIGRRHDLSAFWIPVEGLQVWEGDYEGVDGPLGHPIADVNYRDNRLRQDYEGGYLVLNDEGDVEAVVPGEEEIYAKITALTRTTEGILRQYDGTAWWLDAEGIAHWIPSGDVWECLGGDEVVIDYEVDGFVLATFPVGDTATCPQ